MRRDARHENSFQNFNRFPARDSLSRARGSQGYCSQFDSFPRGLTGREFIRSFLMVSGFTRKEADDLTESALNRVELMPAADRKIGAYSKGIRHRERRAQSLTHAPPLPTLDHP